MVDNLIRFPMAKRLRKTKGEAVIHERNVLQLLHNALIMDSGPDWSNVVWIEDVKEERQMQILGW